MSRPLTASPGVLAVVPAVVLAAFIGLVTWHLWPAGNGLGVDVMVVGDGAVREAKDEIERRFRQEGLVPYVVVVAPAACAAAVDAAPSGARIVTSFAERGACSGARRGGLVVEQPVGDGPVRPAGDWKVRSAAPLFTGPESMPCKWWDTPGAGEARPGLGQCGPDGFVRVLDHATLTPAGRERFARLVVEAVR